MSASFLYRFRPGSWPIPSRQGMVILAMAGGTGIMPVLASSADGVHRLDPVDIRGSHAVGLALT
ncbi:hypothetical protein Q8G40_30235, partial [Klebsiella pneumoniae]|uniref:hypothetical protein n=1 Tax=Klebsiella pneumoniae TaxID=573 RepID=UPI003013AE2B